MELQYNGDGWIETTPEIIKYYNRSGLGPANYFLFEGIKVCEYGKKAECIRNENIPLAVRLHGAAVVGTIDGRD